MYKINSLNVKNVAARIEAQYFSDLNMCFLQCQFNETSTGIFRKRPPLCNVWPMASWNERSGGLICFPLKYGIWKFKEHFYVVTWYSVCLLHYIL
jgi:hypothetical protein